PRPHFLRRWSMFLRARIRPRRVRRFLGLKFESLERRLVPTTFTVTNTNDFGAGSLRQAITDANANPGPDTIQFSIPGSGVQTIQPSYSGGGVSLPIISDTVTIDGWSQGGAGYSGPPLIDIDGTNATDGTLGSFGLWIEASNTVVDGLAINHSPNVNGNGF